MLCELFLMATDLLSQIWYFREADTWNRKAGLLCQKKPLLFGIMFVWSLSFLQIYPGIKSMHLGVSLMLSMLCVFVTKHHWSTQELMSASILAASAAPFSVLGRIYLICLLETMKRVCEVHSHNKPTHIDETQWRSRLRSFFSFSSSNLSRLKTASLSSLLLSSQWTIDSSLKSKVSQEVVFVKGTDCMFLQIDFWTSTFLEPHCWFLDFSCESLSWSFKGSKQKAGSELSFSTCLYTSLSSGPIVSPI